tara:strand:+ start:66 stop:434 length:369 start_codon:yes stop_codon:yes gene_type:complete
LKLSRFDIVIKKFKTNNFVNNFIFCVTFKQIASVQEIKSGRVPDSPEKISSFVLLIESQNFICMTVMRLPKLADASKSMFLAPKKEIVDSRDSVGVTEDGVVTDSNRKDVHILVRLFTIFII